MTEVIRNAVREVLPEVEDGLPKYLAIQQRFGEVDVSQDNDFQSRFKAFYRVRRNPTWQQPYFEIMQEMKQRGQNVSFAEVLDRIHDDTGCWEASFASKLVATLDPSKPVIDSKVLKNLGIRLPGYTHPETRRDRIVEVYERLNRRMNGIVASDLGAFMVELFEKRYGKSVVSNMKMMDFILWKSESPVLREYLQNLEN